MKKRIGALVLALGMVLSMNSFAFAADGDLSGDGIVGNFTEPDKPNYEGNAVILYKEITAYNPETCTVNAPTITYNYTIAAGEAGKDIYDVKTAHNPAANAHATTKAGVGEPTISGSLDDGTTYTSGKLEFTPSVQFSASSAGEKNAYKIKVDFSRIDFTTAGSGAGVYRYVITEDCTEGTKNAAGISDGTITNTRYMDVYVDGSGKIYGFVCFQNNNSIDAQDSPTTNTVAQAAKTEGFVATSTGGTDGATAQTADAYYTFNLDLTKKVENDAYAVSTKHQFPFTVTLDNPNVTAKVLPIMTVGENATQAALSAATIGTDSTATIWKPTIADSAVISYVGIPCGTTITVYETNDVTGVTYSSISTNADTNAAVLAIDTGADSNSAVINCTEHITAADENHTSGGKGVLTFTNTLLQISPTGVVLRVAPFALMLAAGIAILLFSRRRKAAKED